MRFTILSTAIRLLEYLLSDWRICIKDSIYQVPETEKNDRLPSSGYDNCEQSIIYYLTCLFQVWLLSLYKVSTLILKKNRISDSFVNKMF